MNRRRATVIIAMVGVGLTCAGTLGVPLAAADPEERAGSVRGDRQARDVEGGPGSGRGGRTPKPRPPGDNHPDDWPGPRPWRPCPHLYWPPLPFSGNSDGSGGIVIAAVPAVLAATQPAAPVSPTIGPSAERVLTGLDDAVGPPAVGPPSSPPPEAVSIPAAVVPGPVSQPPVAAPAGPRSAAAVPAPSAPPPARRTPEPVAPQSDPVRLGYPPYLADADLARLAGLALPGLAGILGLTALGGLLGYRQARAGYALRAAATGRFLQ